MLYFHLLYIRTVAKIFMQDILASHYSKLAEDGLFVASIRKSLIRFNEKFLIFRMLLIMYKPLMCVNYKIYFIIISI